MYHSAGEFNNRGGYACVGAGGMWEISVASQFCCDPKIALISILEKREIRNWLNCYKRL